jgi:tyrosine-protein kinase Etk/Wzc
MKEEKKYKFNLSTLDLIIFAWNKRLPLIIVTVIAAIVSIIVSYRITPLFKSEVVMFAEPDAFNSKYLLSYSYVGRKGMLSFGEEEESEQLLQVLNSNQIRDRVIEKYNLMDHYDINKSHKYKLTELYKAYNANIKFRRTKYLSVVISVMDKDPEIAANIANDIANLVDTIMNKIILERASVGLRLVKEQLDNLHGQIRVFEDSLTVLNKLGINHYEAQSERLIEAYGYALKDGNIEGARRLQKELQNLSEYGSAYVSIRDQLIYYKQQLYLLNMKYAEARVEAEQALPHKYVVDYAYPAEKKSYPKKSIIVLTSTIAAFIFALFILLVVDIIRRNK